MSAHLRCRRRKAVAILVRSGSTRLRALLCLAALLSLLSATGGGAAPATQGIAAVVNNEVISHHDVDNRINLLVVTANLPNSPEMRQRLRPQVLRALVADALKQQEARRLKVATTTAEIERTVADIARQLNIEPSRLPEFLEARGAKMSTLLKQIETEITWQRTVTRAASAQIAVRDDEIDEEVRRLRDQPTAPIEYRVAEIFLPVESRVDERKVEGTAQQLIEELRRGASFPSLARNFSQGPTAAAGGDLGWVRRGQLPPALDSELDSLDIGEMIGPIRSDTGFHLLLMIDRRQPRPAGSGGVMLSVLQVFAPMAAQTPAQQVEAAVTAMEQMRQDASSCSALEERNRSLPAPFAANVSTVEAEQVPPELRPLLTQMRPGETTQPLRVANGVLLLMLCDRRETDASTEVRDAVRRQIEQRKLAEASQRLLRDLWRNAVTDIRP